MADQELSKKERTDEAIQNIMDDHEEELRTVRDTFDLDNGDVTVEASPITGGVTITLRPDIDLSEYQP